MFPIYVVSAYKYGKNDDHSYLVGLTSDPVQAIRFADVEEDRRGNKYECEIVCFDTPTTYSVIRALKREGNYPTPGRQSSFSADVDHALV